MPYIDKNRRGEVWFPAPRDAGELNFALTSMILSYLKHKGKNYRNINDCLGALEGTKLEFYRRVVAPYEDKKIKENGDIYP